MGQELNREGHLLKLEIGWKIKFHPPGTPMCRVQQRCEGASPENSLDCASFFLISHTHTHRYLECAALWEYYLYSGTGGIIASFGRHTHTCFDRGSTWKIVVWPQWPTSHLNRYQGSQMGLYSGSWPMPPAMLLFLGWSLTQINYILSAQISGLTLQFLPLNKSLQFTFIYQWIYFL